MPDLITVDALKARLRIAADNASAGADLALLVNQTSADFHNATNRHSFLNADYTERRDGQGGDKLVMRHAPLVTVASVIVNGTVIPASPDGVLYGYAADVGGSVVALVGTVFSRGYGNVVVQYTAGFGATINDLPQEIPLAVLDWCEYRYRIRAAAGFTSKHSATGETVSYDKQAMPETTRRVVEQYKRRMAIL